MLSDLFPGFELPGDPVQAARYELHIASVHLAGMTRGWDDELEEYDHSIRGWKRLLRAKRALRNASRKWRAAAYRVAALSLDLKLEAARVAEEGQNAKAGIYYARIARLDADLEAA